MSHTHGPVLSPVALALLGAAACLGPAGDDGLDESEVRRALDSPGGERLVVPDLTDTFEYTRVWRIGQADNVTRVYLLVHGDGNTDYSSSTAADRAEMEARLPAGEGALVAYPVSPSSHWPAFEGGANGRKVLRLVEELRALAGRPDVAFEQFALSGGGRVNHALLRLVVEHADEPDVRAFAEGALRGIHDGDSLCYSIASMKARYVEAIERYPEARFSFIHNTSGTMSYVHSHHEAIAKRFDGGRGYPFGGSLVLQDGRLRFWAAPTHWTAWKGQFARVFLDERGAADAAGAQRVFAGAGTPAGIPDDDADGIRSTAQIDAVAGCTGAVSADVTVRHGYRGDLIVGLTDPSGRRAVLSSREGGATPDLVLRDVPVALGADGLEGEWVLDVSDRERLDEGMLESWALRLRCAP